MAKVSLMLLAHLSVLAVIFYLFVNWQLKLGLNSLLSGATGDRLEALGDLISNDLRTTSRAEWDQIIEDRISPYGLTAVFRRNIELGPRELENNVPKTIVDLLVETRPPKRDAPPEGPRTPRPHSQFQPPQHPERTTSVSLFLARSPEEHNYWAAIEIPLTRNPQARPEHGILFLKSESASANGLFFDYKPWLLGGLAVLLLSLILWAPFVLGITQYARRISKATSRIASGNFDTKIGTNRSDELGDAGQSIEEMSAKIGELVSGQKRFLGDVAHELCAPLARIRTGLGILEGSLPETEKKRIISIDEDAEELSTLVSELLAFTKANSSTTTIESIDLGEILSLLIPRELPDHKVSTEIPPQTNVLADKRLLIRAILNILRNCHRHAGPACEVRIRAKTAGKETTLTIEDNGPGVPENELPKLFQPFYRPDKSRTRATGGTGLGMAIVESSIRASGGTTLAKKSDLGGLAIVITFQS
ncbi:ATP-binding protein [Luteolibacter sp. AS25]|uniref:ATP-binding protein n=1 Tax=Luteolibacter sp. AS25 TaxID=3135776 RepID=UPI00398B7EC9